MFVDSNVPMYTAGREHPVREPARRFLARVRAGAPNSVFALDRSKAGGTAQARRLPAAHAELGDHGRVLIRGSGTEPLVRVMVEAPTHEQAEAAADRVVRAVEGLGAG